MVDFAESTRSRRQMFIMLSIVLFLIAIFAIFKMADLIHIYTYGWTKIRTESVYRRGIEISTALCIYSALATGSIIYGVHFLRRGWRRRLP